MIKAEKFIPKLFLKLTDKTYPHGTENILVDRLIKDGTFPKDIQQDAHGNWFYEIGHGSRTIFASHLDTVTDKHQSVKHVFDGDYIKTDGTTTLGADDKAGVSILIWLMKHNIPGTYYFFIGEEVGCVGSGLAAKYGEFEGKYDRILSFDRRDTNSIITHQSWSRSCSDDFADALCSELNKSEFGLKYIKDDGGVYTDSAEFVELIPECTNVSVGYYSEHTKSEKQNIKHLIALCNACLKVDWENLPTKRDPKAKETKSYKSYTGWGTYSSGAYSRDYDYYDGYTSRTGGSWTRTGYNKKKNRGRDYDDSYDNIYNMGGDIYEYPSRIEEDEFFIGGKKSKNRGSRGKKKSKTYFDNGSGLVELSIDDKQYKWALSKFSENLTLDELEIIKDQYMDADSEYDTFFIESLRSAM